MKILIVCNHYPVCSGRYAADAFKRLGHEVRHVGPAMGRYIWGMDVPQEYVWTPDGAPGTEWGADLIIVMDSDPAILDGHIQLAKTLGPNTVIVWGVDNHVRDYRHPYFDHYFLAHRKVSVMKWIDWTENVPVPEGSPEGIASFYPKTHFYNDMTHLPCAYDPIHFTPSPIPYTERAYDVAMIGVMYPERWRLVNELRAAGLKVLGGTGLIYEAYRDAYHNARISLCVSSNGDVAQRVFETAAMGCVVVTDDCPDYHILNPDCFWVIDADVPFVEQIRGILADPVTAQAQIARSQAWAVPHTWDNRAQQVIQWWEANHA